MVNKFVLSAPILVSDIAKIHTSTFSPCAYTLHVVFPSPHDTPIKHYKQDT